MKFSEEQIKIVQSCGSAQELVEKAAQSGIDLSSEQAAAILASSEFEELDQEKLDTVSGGCNTTQLNHTCRVCRVDFGYDLPKRLIPSNGIDGNGTAYVPVCDDCYDGKKWLK